MRILSGNDSEPRPGGGAWRTLATNDISISAEGYVAIHAIGTVALS